MISKYRRRLLLRLIQIIVGKNKIYWKLMELTMLYIKQSELTSLHLPPPGIKVFSMKKCGDELLEICNTDYGNSFVVFSTELSQYIVRFDRQENKLYIDKHRHPNGVSDITQIQTTIIS